MVSSMSEDFLKDDSFLVEGCIKRDLTAWASFVQKYSGLIFISIEKRLKNYGLALPRPDIEDIKQNVLTLLWRDRKLESVRNRQNIAYWLAIVSGNIAIEYMRKKRAIEPHDPISIFDKIGEKELVEFIPSRDSSPADELVKAEISKRIGSAIEELPNKEKLIMKLNILHNKKYHEIADILHIPKGTVSSYIKRAKEKLRASLEDLK